MNFTKYQRQSKAWDLFPGYSAGDGFAGAHGLATRAFSIMLLGHLREVLEDSRRQSGSKLPSADVQYEVCEITAATDGDISAPFQSMSPSPWPINSDGRPLALSTAHIHPPKIEITTNTNTRSMYQLTIPFLPTLCSNEPC